MRYVRTFKTCLLLVQQTKVKQLVFRSASAFAHANSLTRGFWHIEYSGPMTKSCFAEFRAAVVGATQGTKGLIFQMEKMLSIGNLVPPIPVRVPEKQCACSGAMPDGSNAGVERVRQEHGRPENHSDSFSRVGSDSGDADSAATGWLI